MDMSALDLFLLCEYRYHVRYNLRKSLPMLQKSKALDTGTLLHEGFEAYYKAMKEGLSFDKRLEAAKMKIRATACDPEKSNSEPEELPFFLQTIEENLEYWRSDDEHMIIHAVEEAFANTLYEDESIRIIITGKIDLLVDIPQLGRNAGYTNLPIDHKSYSRDFPLFRLSNQFMNYTQATRSNYLLVNRVGLQKTVPVDKKFKREPLSYDPAILNEWKDNTVKVILGRYAECHASEFHFLFEV